MSFLNRHEREELDAHITGVYEDTENADDVVNYLSDIYDRIEVIESHLSEIVNQGDAQVEFLSRLVTLFESAMKEAQ